MRAASSLLTLQNWSMRQHIVVSGDAELHVVDHGGAGTPVVILHGLAGSSTEFEATASALDGRRVLRIDARGHGRSTRHPSDVSREAHVSDVVRVIEQLVVGPVSLIGQSMGGHTAMLVAAARPDLIERMVLLEAGVGGDGSASSRAAMREFFRSWPIPFENPAHARTVLGDDSLGRAWIADLEPRADGLWPRFDADVMAETIEHVDSSPRWAEWERVVAPTLAVFATDGMFDDQAKTEFVGRGNWVRSADISGSHDAHLDAFDEWMGAVLPFLRLPLSAFP